MRYVGGNRNLATVARHGDIIPRFATNAERDAYYTASDTGTAGEGMLCTVGPDPLHVQRWDPTSSSWLSLSSSIGKLSMAKAVSVTLASAAVTKIPLNLDFWDSAFSWSSSAPSDVVLRYAGWYAMDANVNYDVNATTTMRVFQHFLLLPGTYYRGQNLPGDDEGHCSALICTDTPDAVVRLEAYQNSGASKTIQSVHLSMSYLGAPQ